MNLSKDLELLARFGPTIEGRALELIFSGGGAPAKRGRPDFVDEHHEELAGALRARACLELLRRTKPGALHAAVLEFAYVRLGPVYREPSLEDMQSRDEWYRLLGAWHRWHWCRGDYTPLVDSIDPRALLLRVYHASGLIRGSLLAAGRRLHEKAVAAYEATDVELKRYF